MTIEQIEITNLGDAPALDENAWVGPLLAFVVVVYGSAWAYCTAVCGIGEVRECETAWFPPRVRGECE